ncbi:MAG: hypothetical protein ACREC6_14305 [Hyphomicrobiaceae bacterium]
MRNVFKTGMSAAAVGGVLAALVAGAAVAQGAGKSTLRDEVVQSLMDMTWGQIPAKFTLPNGKTIVFDKKKPNEIQVPLEVAREIVVAAYRSYEADICGLLEEMLLNRESMMLRMLAKQKWTEQQLQYINMLHGTVIRYTKGQIEIRLMPDGEKQVNPKDVPVEKTLKAKTCADDRRKRVKDAVAAYVKSGPPMLPPAKIADSPPAAGSPPAGAPPAQPTPAATKK